MFTTLKNGAEQEAEIVTRWESGAETEADAVYAYKNGAEEEVWSNKAYYFMQDGVLMNGAMPITGEGITAKVNQDGYYQIQNTLNATNSSAGIYIPGASQFVGKTLYVVGRASNYDMRYMGTMMPNSGDVYYRSNLPEIAVTHNVTFVISSYATYYIKDIYIE